MPKLCAGANRHFPKIPPWQPPRTGYLFPPRDGGHSSMVEYQIVILGVAGSSPVGHPLALSRRWDSSAALLKLDDHALNRAGERVRIFVRSDRAAFIAADAESIGWHC